MTDVDKLFNNFIKIRDSQNLANIADSLNRKAAYEAEQVKLMKRELRQQEQRRVEEQLYQLEKEKEKFQQEFMGQTSDFVDSCFSSDVFNNLKSLKLKAISILSSESLVEFIKDDSVGKFLVRADRYRDVFNAIKKIKSTVKGFNKKTVLFNGRGNTYVLYDTCSYLFDLVDAIKKIRIVEDLLIKNPSGKIKSEIDSANRFLESNIDIDYMVVKSEVSNLHEICEVIASTANFLNSLYEENTSRYGLKILREEAEKCGELKSRLLSLDRIETKKDALDTAYFLINKTEEYNNNFVDVDQRVSEVVTYFSKLGFLRRTYFPFIPDEILLHVHFLEKIEKNCAEVLNALAGKEGFPRAVHFCNKIKLSLELISSIKIKNEFFLKASGRRNSAYLILMLALFALYLFIRSVSEDDLRYPDAAPIDRVNVVGKDSVIIDNKNPLSEITKNKSSSLDLTEKHEPLEDPISSDKNSRVPNVSNNSVLKVPDVISSQASDEEDEKNKSLESIVSIEKLEKSKIVRSWSPGFDCNKATDSVEKMICEDKNLSLADLQMNQFYTVVFNNTRQDKKFLVESQKKWLVEERGMCLTKECVAESYKKRMRFLLKNF